MDVKYAPADIDEMISKCTLLTNNERNDLKSLLTKFKPSFDGTLGTSDTELIDLEHTWMLSHIMQSNIQFLNLRKPNSKPKSKDWFLMVC